MFQTRFSEIHFFVFYCSRESYRDMENAGSFLAKYFIVQSAFASATTWIFQASFTRAIVI